MFRRLVLAVTLLASPALVVPILTMPVLAGGLPLTVANRDPAIEAKIADLVSRMTLEEKIGQMFIESWTEELDGAAIEAGGYGAIINCPSAETVAEAAARAAKSRLGIPLLFGRDIIHGYRTLFPVPLGLAASFDPEVWAKAAEMTSREAASHGVNFTFGPMVDVSRDGRWGRTVEGPGEDPWLGARYAEAYVRGQRRGGLASTMKHFVGYGAARAGRDYAEADISTPTLHDVHLAPFRAGLGAGADLFMAAFSVLNGVPGTVNARMNLGLLKRDWGFDGPLITDWDGIRELLNHGLAVDEAQATERAINAGIDMEIAGHFVPRHLPELVRSGRVSTERIDDAVTRILRLKFRLGLFDAPGVKRDVAPPIPLAAPEIRAAAHDAARRSIVLLKNEHELLPLTHPPKRILVVGHAAVDASDHMGAWGAVALQEDTPLFYKELKRRLEPRGVHVSFAEGCDDDCLEPDPKEFAEAEAAAGKADLVIAMLGEPWYMTAESTSRTRLGLPNQQQKLLDRLARTGKPIVLVTLAGRGMAMGEAVAKARAVFYAFSPGTMTGPALVDLLLGEATPSARLPVSLPRSVGQLPMSYDRLPTGRPDPSDKTDNLWSRYIDEEVTPLYPFGFGLSYTTFTYGRPRLAKATVGLGGRISVDVPVSNTGERAGREMVQLYVRQPVAMRSRPVRQLKAIARVDLKPGETQIVRLEVPVAELAFHDDDGRGAVEPGRFEIFVGGSSEATAKAEFEVVAR